MTLVCMLPVEIFKQRAGQHRKIPSLAQSRQRDGENIEPVEQIFTEPALFGMALSSGELVAAITRTSS